MKRFLIVAMVLLFGADFALAQSVSDKVFANLKAQGYSVVQQDRTWLGRIWVLARNKTVQREVVFDPTTGEILRDYAVSLAELDAQKNYDLAQDSSNDSQSAGAAVVASDPNVAATVDVLSDPVVESVPTDSVANPNAANGL